MDFFNKKLEDRSPKFEEWFRSEFLKTIKIEKRVGESLHLKYRIETSYFKLPTPNFKKKHDYKSSSQQPMFQIQRCFGFFEKQ